MNTKKVILQRTRIFSEEFKRSCVKDYELGQHTVSELAQLYHIHFTTIYAWIYKYSLYNKKKIRVVEMADSSTKKVKELQERVRDLERIIGQKQLNIDFLEKMIEIAKDQLGIDMKKNFNTSHLDGSDSTEKKQDVR
jgi:transposase